MERAADMASPADTTATHLRGELRLLELRLQRDVLRARVERGATGRQDEFAGLYISDEEIDRYLRDVDEGAADAETAAAISALDARIAICREELEKDVRDAEERVGSSRLGQLREAFSLPSAEYSMIVACLAVELDLRYERYFAYLQNDVSRRRPCVQLLGRLFLEDAHDHAALARIFASSHSLVGTHLLEMGKGAHEAGFAAREPRVTEGLLHFLLSVDGQDTDWKGLGRWREGKALPDRPAYFCRHQEILGKLAGHVCREGRLPRTFIRGPGGCAKEDLVLALGQTLCVRIMEWDAEEVIAFSGDWTERLRVMARDIRLHAAFLWLRHAEVLMSADGPVRSRLKALASFLAERPWVNLVMTGDSGPGDLRSAFTLAGVPVLELALEAPDVSERAELWRALVELHSPAEGNAPSRALWDSLAAKFCFGPGQIVSALRGLEGEPLPEPGAPGWEGALHRACRQESSSSLDGFARKLPVKYRWQDLVLPSDLVEQLREIGNCVRYRRRVYGEWGFEDKFSLGKGLNLLFSGPSGTGKTMSAEVLAADLGLDLYRIDLSAVVSKYIGETEKNLSRIFREAQSANCILLFDEADALFGKRSEVKDSHDRYANIEINYLLQRVEEYEGTIILTTNMLKNLDPAFTRRIHYTVEFLLPDEHQREAMWSKVFPAGTPRSSDLDLDFLARRFKLTGANIKSIALNGAFLAAANGGTVDMAHLMLALKREYRKLGKLVSKSELGPYYHLVRDDPHPPTTGPQVAFDAGALPDDSSSKVEGA